MEELIERVERLERECRKLDQRVRRWKFSGIATGVATSVLIFAGAQRTSSNETIEAHTFNLKTKTGQKVGEWTAKDGFPVLTFLDKNNEVQITLMTSEIGSLFMIGRADRSQVMAAAGAEAKLAVYKNSKKLFEVPPE